MKKKTKNILCSVSAGYSSVMMAIKLKEWFPDHTIVNAMANTSKERRESLEFMNKCDKHYGLNLVWIEAEINQERRRGTGFKVVRYDDLKTNGEIFEAGIKKYGIPNRENKWCTRDLKLVPLTKFAKSFFGGREYSVAVGLRADEMDRVRADYKENNIFYPLLDKNIGARARNKFWKDQPIQIQIPAFKGNCDLCFEKSNRKLMTILKEDSNTGQWWSDMIDKYGTIPKPTSDSYNDLMERVGYQTFFRNYNKIEDLIKLAEQPFYPATDEYVYENDLFDLEGDCGSGCNVF